LKGGIAACFVELVHAFANEVFHQLKLSSLRVREFPDARGNRFAPGQFGSPVAARPDDEFIRTIASVPVWAHNHGLQYPVLFDVGGEFGQGCFIEMAARVGFRFVDFVQGNFAY